MKIVYVGTGNQSIGMDSETAVELVINNLAIEVKKLGNDIVIIDIFDDSRNRDKNIKYDYIRLPRFLEKKTPKPGSPLHALKKIIFSLKTYFLIKKISKNEKIDIIHIQNQYPGIILFTLLKKKMKNTGFAYTSHTPFWTFDDTNFKKYYYKTYMDRISMKKSDKTIFVGYTQMENARRRIKLSQDKIEVIQNGVDLIRFHPKINDKKNKKTVILSVARISDVKNQLLIIKAIPEIIKHNKNIEFQFVGQLEDETYLRQINEFIKLNKIEEYVKIIGPVKNEALANYYQNSDIFISASNAEGLPLTVLEAMASGCAIILSDIGPHKEIQKNQEIIFFKKDDLDDLRKKLIGILDNKTMVTLKKKSFDSATRYFSWRTVAMKNIEVYKKINSTCH
jgi:glycosyltransferase involved in cell wall biosynthesis